MRASSRSSISTPASRPCRCRSAEIARPPRAAETAAVEEHAMKIIDAQVHIWGSGTPGDDHRQVSAFTVEELLAEMAQAGVDGAILHPPVSWDPDANALSEAAAAKHPGRFAILGQVPLDQPGTSRPLLASWRATTGAMRPALPAGARRSAELALRWHDGLALAGGRGSGPAHRHHGLAVSAAIRRGRRTPPEAAPHHRPLRADPHRQGRGRLRQPRCRCCRSRNSPMSR